MDLLAPANGPPDTGGEGMDTWRVDRLVGDWMLEISYDADEKVHAVRRQNTRNHFGLWSTTRH
jgi:hypothetical protein